jgi:hypothetical protein
LSLLTTAVSALCRRQIPQRENGFDQLEGFPPIAQVVLRLELFQAGIDVRRLGEGGNGTQKDEHDDDGPHRTIVGRSGSVG